MKRHIRILDQPFTSCGRPGTLFDLYPSDYNGYNTTMLVNYLYPWGDGDEHCYKCDEIPLTEFTTKDERAPQ